MDILIKNANLISMEEKRDIYEENIDILIKDKEIYKIGRDIKLDNEDVKVIDATSKYVIPGFINTHAHVPMSIFRETIDGYNLQDWLEKKIWPMEDKLLQQDIYYATLLSGIEMIKTGTTTINDMYFLSENSIKAALELGIRMQTTRTLMSLNDDKQSRISELENLINEYNNKNDLITFNIGVHGLYTTKLDYLKESIKLADKYNLPIHIHFCENSKEVEDIIKEYKMQPVNVLKEYIGNRHTILAHAVKLNEDDIRNLKDLNVYISHCPISNLKLGCGVAKVQHMVNERITVSLGSDGQGSGSNLDMFETMKFTALLQKGVNENPLDLPAYEVLKMATINGAKALGIEKEIGSISVGKKADLIILNLDNEVTQPVNNVLSDIVYNAKGSNVDTTIINGKILMENRKVLGVDEKYIYEKCKNIIERIR